MKRLGTIALFVLAACDGGSAGPQTELRAAVDRAQVSLAGSVQHAQDSIQFSAGINARIHKDVDQYEVGAVATSIKHELWVDFTGAVVSRKAAGAAGAGCQTQISLNEALAIAESAAGGDAVQVVPDDDDPCMREIQVLVDATLWEVKVGPDGAVVEQELSDEEL